MIATIEQFSEQYRVKRLPAGRLSKRCGNKPIELTEDVVEGKVGFIGEGWGDGRMILHILAVPRDADMNSKLASRNRIAEAAGMSLKVKSGYEAEWYFDPNDEKQALAAIECVSPKRRRTVGPEQCAAAVARFAAARAVKAVQISI